MSDILVRRHNLSQFFNDVDGSDLGAHQPYGVGVALQAAREFCKHNVDKLVFLY